MRINIHRVNGVVIFRLICEPGKEDALTGINEAALTAREREEAELEKAMPIVGYCCQCEEPIRGHTDSLEGDYYIESEDGLVHWDCWDAYGETKKKEA